MNIQFYLKICDITEIKWVVNVISCWLAFYFGLFIELCVCVVCFCKVLLILIQVSFLHLTQFHMQSLFFPRRYTENERNTQIFSFWTQICFNTLISLWNMTLCLVLVCIRAVRWSKLVHAPLFVSEPQSSPLIRQHYKRLEKLPLNSETQRAFQTFTTTDDTISALIFFQIKSVQPPASLQTLLPDSFNEYYSVFSRLPPPKSPPPSSFAIVLHGEINLSPFRCRLFTHCEMRI